MENVVLGRLMQALVDPDVRSLTLAPGCEAAVVHIRPAGKQGWVFTLRCRPVLAALLDTAVARGGGETATVEGVADSQDGAPQVQLELGVHEPQLAGRVLDVLLRDHARTRPDERLSAFVLEEGEPVARAARALPAGAAPRPLRDHARRPAGRGAGQLLGQVRRPDPSRVRGARRPAASSRAGRLVA